MVNVKPLSCKAFALRVQNLLYSFFPNKHSSSCTFLSFTDDILNVNC
jgi:hypothetical protein